MNNSTNNLNFSRHRLVGFVAGPMAALFILLTPPPAQLSVQGWWVAGVALWMAIWWMTEALPLVATALLPVVMFPLLGLSDIAVTAEKYAHPLIFLFLGGFLMARALNVWGLDRRLALKVMSIVGSSPRRLLAGIMLVTAFLSMWVSNTATSMVMLPIGLSIVATFSEYREQDVSRIAPAVLLGIAYAATIGGMGTIIGTPPNALFVAFMADTYGIEISFICWMLIGVPMLLLLLPLAWFILSRVFHVEVQSSQQATNAIIANLTALASVSIAERLVGGVLILVAVCWVLRPLLVSVFPGLNLSDAGIAMTGALLMFMFPVNLTQGRFILSWKEASTIRWDVLILFGGGLALASAIGESDLANWIGAQLIVLGSLPMLLLLIAIGVLIVFVGELASNTAMAAVFLPIAGATALSMGEPVIVLALPVALFATLGFMLPVATPPNAIVFGSGAVEMRHMLKAGIILDIVGIVVVSLAIMTIGQWLFGIR